ncbi:O-antigen ligase family protein [Arthrobacter sp. HMWF013]|uniref:O-antigen ligase family protein n=1 Tax=Arthrobacter sp. HMWF013 TaxID=2056849 RepID=UPI000D34F623|nr:O-antigen ligase family protein [Arthrobacter sp. HMWF013]PTT69450.1 hypothetical protein DBR22_03850 [Arthrobacter sp. HMWF013]
MGTANQAISLRPSLLTPTKAKTPFSTILLWVGLFSVSWDRFAGISVGTFNLKLPIVAFALAFALTLVDRVALRRPPMGAHPAIGLALAVIIAYFVGALFALDTQLAVIQFGTVVLGAFLPFLAVFTNLRTFGGLDSALTAFIRGGILASVFGLYQLTAFYAGLPQLIQYEATGGGLGRISSFSYEAAYFAYFLILVIAAVFARAHITKASINIWLVGFLLIVLILANSRATVFTLPLLLVLAFFRRPDKSLTKKLTPLFLITIWVLVFMWLALPDIYETFFERAATIFDPTEQSSNAPRLDTYDAAWVIAQQDLLTGIGGGNFRDALAAMTGVHVPGISANELIANNVWLQALLDGGVILLAAEAILVIVAARTLYRRAIPGARLLMAGWLSALLVSSMVTSYFFDVKIWVVLALALAVAKDQIGSAPEFIGVHSGRTRQPSSLSSGT